MDCHGTVFVLGGNDTFLAISVFVAATAVFLLDCGNKRFAGAVGFSKTKQGSNLYEVPLTLTLCYDLPPTPGVGDIANLKNSLYEKPTSFESALASFSSVGAFSTLAMFRTKMPPGFSKSNAP